MLIVPKPSAYTLQQFVARIFNGYSTLLEHTSQQVRQTAALLALEQLLAILFDFSIVLNLHSPTNWNCLEIIRLRYALSYLSLPEIFFSLGTSAYQLVCICIFVFVGANAALLGLILLHSGDSPLLTFAAYLFRVSRVLYRPVVFALVFSVMSEQLAAPLKIGSVLLLLLFLVVVLLNAKLYFNPLPTNNQFYQADNQYEFFDFILVLARAVLIGANADLQKTILVLLAFEVSRLSCFGHVLACPPVQVMSTLPSQLMVVLYLFILVNDLTRDISQPIFYFWCISMLGLLAYKWTQLNLPDSKKLQLANCKDSDRESICQLLVSYREAQRSQNEEQVCRIYSSFLYGHIEGCKSEGCYLRAGDSFAGAAEATDRAKLEKRIDQFVLKLLETWSLNDQLLAVQYYMNLYALLDRKLLGSFSRRVESFHLQFVVFHFSRILQKDVVSQDYRVTDENFTESKKMLLSQLKKTAQSFGRLFGQQKLQKTSMSQLEKISADCLSLTFELKRLFVRILQNPKLDLPLVEFYFEFSLNFLKETELMEQFLEKIGKKNDQYKYEDCALDECPFAYFSLNMESASIIDCNLEVVKILGWEKTDLVEHPIRQFLLAEFEQEEWADIFASLAEVPSLCFLRTRFRGLLVARLNSRINQYAGKKQYLLCLTQVPRASNVAYVAVQADLTVQDTDRPSLSLRQHDLQTEQVYAEFVQPIWTQLLKYQQMTVDCDRDSLYLAIELCNSFDRLADVVRIELRQRNGVRNPATTFKTIRYDTLQTPYYFYYCPNVSGSKRSFRFASESVYIEGGRSDNLSLQVNFSHSKTALAIAHEQPNYADGIKSYRLSGDRIFNIELEQPEAGEFAKVKSKNYGLSPFLLLLNNQRLFLAAMLTLFAAGAVATFYCEFKQSAFLGAAGLEYHSYNCIELLELRYYRLACMLRDVDQDIAMPGYQQWAVQARSILDSIQTSQESRLFSNLQYTISFLNVTYTDKLDELFDVVLSVMDSMVTAENTSLTEDIHYLIVNQLQKYVFEEKDQVRATTSDLLQRVGNLAAAKLTALLVVALLFALLMLTSEHADMKARIELMLPLRLMSDAQLDNSIARLQNYESLLLLNEKGIEVSVFNCLEDSTEYQRRAAAKQCDTGLCQRKLLLVGLLLLVCAGSGANSYVYLSTLSNISTSEEYMMLNRAITESYISYLYMTIDYENGVSEAVVNQTSFSLSAIEDGYQAMPFSSSFNQFILETYFQNACSNVQALMPALDCENYAPYTNFRNPFKEGLVIYFHHVYFNIDEDSRETIPSTGVAGRPFMLLMEKILADAETQWTLYANSIKEQQALFILVEVLQLCVMLGIYCYARQRSEKSRKLVRDICSLLKLNWQLEPQQGAEPSNQAAEAQEMAQPAIELL